MMEISVILTVGALSVVAVEPLGFNWTAAAEFPLAITIVAALTLVTVDVATVLRGKRQTRTENRDPYNLQAVNADAFSNGLMSWQGGQAAFAARYCDRCGNRL
jgi:hypothetical protein